MSLLFSLFVTVFLPNVDSKESFSDKIYVINLQPISDQYNHFIPEKTPENHRGGGGIYDDDTLIRNGLIKILIFLRASITFERNTRIFQNKVFLTFY